MVSSPTTQFFMKTSTLIGLSLTLLMLLLVLLAAFLFLFQGRQALEQQHETELSTLQQRLAESDLRLTSLEGTRVAIDKQLLTPQAQELATFQAENSILNQQSVDDLREIEQLRQMVTQVANGEALPTPEVSPQPVVVLLLSPENNETFTLDESIEVILAARDDQGIEKIELMINDKLEATIEGNGNTFVTDKRPFSFASAGVRVLEAKLTNVAGGVTMTQLIRIEVVLPSETEG